MVSGQLLQPRAGHTPGHACFVMCESCVGNTLTLDFRRYRYPSRLIDLGEVTDEKNERTQSEEVRLVLNTELLQNGPVKDRFYVTLRHCWGKAKFTTLTEHNIAQFRRGIRIDTLPRTFRDVIYFARRLSRKVRYLWIDSLCIIQGKSDAQYADWVSPLSWCHDPLSCAVPRFLETFGRSVQMSHHFEDFLKCLKEAY